MIKCVGQKRNFNTLLFFQFLYFYCTQEEEQKDKRVVALLFKIWPLEIKKNV
jgi:hypothetical protein